MKLARAQDDFGETIRDGGLNLRRRDRRAASGHCDDRANIRERVELMRAGNKTAMLPVGRERHFDTGRTDDERVVIQKCAHGVKLRFVEEVDEDDFGAIGLAVFERELWIFRQLGEVDEADLFFRLLAKMKAKIGFAHRCHRMSAHRWVSIKAIDLAGFSEAGKKMPENAIPS